MTLQIVCVWLLTADGKSDRYTGPLHTIHAFVTKNITPDAASTFPKNLKSISIILVFCRIPLTYFHAKFDTSLG